MYQKLIFVLLFISVLLVSKQVDAEEIAPSDSLLSISLKDGTILKGKIIKEDKTTIIVITMGSI